MKNVRILLYLLIFLIFLDSSIAFLISPPSYEIDFEPNSEKSFNIVLINNRQEDITLDTYIKTVFLHPTIAEELKDAFSLNTSQIHFTEDVKYAAFTLTIKFPEKLSLEGIHDLRVGAVESAGEGQVAFRAANEVRVLIKNGEEIIIPPRNGENNLARINQTKGTLRPMPPQQELDINILNITAEDVFQGEKSEIIIKIKNNENFKVTINTLIHITKGNRLIDTINLHSISIDPLKETNIKTFWDTKFNPVGEYNIEATISYQGGSKKVTTTMKIKEKSFFSLNLILILSGILALILFIILLTLFLLSYGKEGIRILDITTKNISPISIGNIIIKYKNYSSKDYKKCILKIKIIDLSNKVVDLAEEKLGIVKAKKEDSYNIKWKPQNIPLGIYKINAIIQYDNKITEKSIRIKL